MKSLIKPDCTYLMIAPVSYPFISTKKSNFNYFNHWYLTKAKTYTCYSGDASPVRVLQIGKNGSRHVLTLLVVSQKADDQFIKHI